MDDEGKVVVFIASLVFMFLVIINVNLYRGHTRELELKRECISASVPVLECNDLVKGR